MIRVWVTASSPVVRAGLEALLRDNSHFAIASPSSQPALPNSARDSDANVLLMEVASTERLRSHRLLTQNGEASTVLLADGLKRTDLLRVLQSGVRAILPRDAQGHEIITAIEAVAAGLTVLSSEEMDALLPVVIQEPDRLASVDEPLTTRELEVLGMMAEGLGNKDIAAHLNITEHTVKFHVSSILGKLGSTTRGGAVARGVREGLIAI